MGGDKRAEKKYRLIQIDRKERKGTCVTQGSRKGSRALDHKHLGRGSKYRHHVDRILLLDTSGLHLEQRCLKFREYSRKDTECETQGSRKAAGHH